MDFKVVVYSDNLDKRLLLGLLLTSTNQDFSILDDGKVHSDWDEGSWYDMEIDMTRISEEFPDTLFTVDLTDEEGGNERYYWKNGSYYSVEAEFPAFDESRLK